MSGHLIRRSMRGSTKEQMIRRRDAAPGEMEMLAKTMGDPNPNPEEITSYIRELLKKEHISGDDARQLLATVPHDPEALRTWAKQMFAVVMHHGIHAEAAYPKQLYPSPQEPQPQAAPAAAPQPPQGP